MLVAFKSEVFHRRECLTRRIEYSCHQTCLLAEVLATGTNGKGIHLGLSRIHLHINSMRTERKEEYGTVEPEVLCCIHKVQETWNYARACPGEANDELLEARGGDPTNKPFQVTAITSGLEQAKVRKSDVSHD
jgi:hypothetical protein